MTYLPNRKILFLSCIIACVVLGALTACTNLPGINTATPEVTAAPPTPTPLPRGGTLSIGTAADVPDLRPWQPRSRGEEQAIELMYTGLTHLDDKLEPRPDLAERWDISADGRLITFTLRTNLNWHDGAPLTAEDVAYTIGALREITPTTALIDDLRTRIASVTTIATRTIEISLTERYAPILADLAVPILPKHLLNGKNLRQINFWDIPVGSGPFKFDAREPGTSISFSAHPQFYRGPPLLDHVKMEIMPDANATAKALTSGQVLIGEVPAGIPFQNVSAGEYLENGGYFLAMNTRQGRPFADPQVRNALAAAIDLPALVHQVTNDTGRAISSDAALNSWASFIQPPASTTELTRAATLLDEAGWRQTGSGAIRQRDGQQLAGTILVRADDQRRIAAAEQIATVARTIGISLTVQPADNDTTIREKYLPPYDFDLLLGSWVGGPGDPAYGDYMFYDPDDYALFHSSQINQGPADMRAVLNFTGFSDPIYDAQIVTARQLYDVTTRGDALKQAQQRLNELKPYLWLWSDRTVVALNTRVTTLDGPININSPLYLWNIERWYLTP